MFVTGVGQNQRMINLSKVTDSLGPKKTLALLGPHALSRSDHRNIGKKAKTFFWRVFSKADVSKLGSLENFLDKDFNTFNRKVYMSSLCIWHKYIKHWRTEVVDDHKERKFATTKGVTDTISNYHNLPSPLNFGWKLKEINDQYVPTMCCGAVFQLIRCSCVKRKCAPPCTMLFT